MDSTSLRKANELTKGRAQSAVNMEILWRNVFAHIVLHLMGIYGLYVSIVSAELLTFIYGKLKRLNFKVIYTLYII